MVVLSSVPAVNITVTVDADAEVVDDAGVVDPINSTARLSKHGSIQFTLRGAQLNCDNFLFVPLPVAE